MQTMFAVGRKLREEFPEEADYRAAIAAWRKENPIEAGTIHDVIDHIDHIAKVAGVNHVGLGSDYDGVGTLPKQLEDVSSYPLITQALLDRGYSHDDIRKILGQNLMRAFRGAEKVSREWGKDR